MAFHWMKNENVHEMLMIHSRKTKIGPLKQQKQFMEKDLVQTPSPSIPDSGITWEEFEKHYSRELLIMDCIDWIKSSSEFGYYMLSEIVCSAFDQPGRISFFTTQSFFESPTGFVH